MFALLSCLVGKLKSVVICTASCADGLMLHVGAYGVSGLAQSKFCWRQGAFALLMLLLCFPVLAQTQVSGAIAVDTHWDSAGAPYVISGDVVIQNGAVLSIDPGVTVYMGAGSSLNVRAGAVNASGSAAKPIRVLSDKVRLGLSPLAGDWNQWTFGSGAVNTHLEHVEFAHGHGVAVNGSAPVFNHLNIHHNFGAAITVDLAASPSGIGNQASENGVNGIVVPAGDISGSVKWGVRGIPYFVPKGAVSIGVSPVVTSVTPDTLQQGETATVSLVGRRLKGLSAVNFEQAGLSAQVLAGANDTQAQLLISAGPSAVEGAATLRLLVDAGDIRVPDILKISRPQPVLSALAPETLYLGQGVVDVLLSGRGISSQSIVLVDDVAVPTAYLSPSELRASITVPASVTNLSVRLRTPDPVNAGGALDSNGLVLPVLPPQLQVTPSVISVSKGGVRTFTATLPYAAPSGGISLNLVSSVPMVAVAPVNLVVPEGERSANFQVEAKDIGITTLTVSKLGFVSAQAQITVVSPPTLTVAPSQMTLGIGRTAELTIQSSIPAGEAGLSVALNSSDPSIATLPASITIPTGDKTAKVSLSSLKAGTVKVTAKATDFVNGVASITVKPLSLNMPSGALVAPGLMRSVPITLSDPAPEGGLEIQLSSSAEEFVSVPTKVTVEEGKSSINYSLAGIAAGAASVTAIATGYQQATMPVTVEAVSIGIGSPTVSQISVAEETAQRYSINLSRPAPVGGVAVELAIADTTKATVTPGAVMIEEGQTSAGIVLATISGVSKGATELSANAAGLNAASVSVTITDKPALVFSKTAVKVGKGLQTYLSEVGIYRRTGGGNYASNQAQTVSLTSSDPTKVVVPATVTIPAGTSSVNFYVIGVDMTDGVPVVIDATAEGHSTPTTKLSVNVVAPVFSFNALDQQRSVASIRDDFYLSVTVPGASYSSSQTAVADLPISLNVVEATTAGIVNGFYRTSTGDDSVSHVVLHKGEHFSDTVFVGVPTAAGSYKVQASAAGGVGDSSTVTVSAPELSFSKSNVVVGKGLNTYLSEIRINRTVNGQVFTGQDALTVSLSSSDSTKASVPSTVTIPAGSGYVNFYVTGVDVTDGVPVTIDAAAEGYSAPAIKLSTSVVAPVFNYASLDSQRSPASVRDNFQVYVYVPGATYPGNQTAAADLPINLEIIEASPTGVVDGFYSAQTGGGATNQVILRSGNTYSDWSYIGVPTAAGSYKVQASAAGGVGDSSTVTVSAPELSFSKSNAVVGKGLNTYLSEIRINRTVNGQVFTGQDALTVSLSSSDSTKASVPSTVTIPAGSGYVNFYVTGVDVTDGLPVTIDAAAEGYSAPEVKLSTSVVAPVFKYVSLDSQRSPASVRDNFQVYVYVPGAAYSSSQTAAADLPINLEIVEASPTGVVDGFYSAQTGGVSTNQVILRSGSTYSDWAYVGVPNAAGSYKVQAVAAGISSATSSVTTVSMPQLRFTKSAAIVGEGLRSYGYELYVERTANGTAFAGTEALVVDLSCSSRDICKVPASVTIPAGASSVQIQIDGVGLGNTTVSANAPGYSLVQELPVSVVVPRFYFSNLGDLTVGGQRNFYLYTYVSGVSYNTSQTVISDLNVNLSSSAPDVATVPASVVIRAGSSGVGGITLRGIGAGEMTITASGNGMSSTTSGVITINP